jgi:solute carrier family 25 protein 16
MLTSLLGSNSHIGKFLAGSGAGVTAVTLTYPLDTIRARLAFQVTGEHVYSGIVQTALSIFKEVCLLDLNFCSILLLHLILLAC